MKEQPLGRPSNPNVTKGKNRQRDTRACEHDVGIERTTTYSTGEDDLVGGMGALHLERGRIVRDI